MNDIERQKKVLNMMVTAHSVLANQYSFQSTFVEISLLVASAVLNALVIADPKFIQNLTTLTEGTQKTIIAVTSVIVFVFSLILLQVKWKEKAENHQKTADQLFILLQECRLILHLDDIEQKNLRVIEFDKKYIQLSGILAKIPDSQFNKLKAHHNNKVELSKLIDNYPGANYWILKARLFLSSFAKKR